MLFAWHGSPTADSCRASVAVQRAGLDATLECVGTGQSFATAIAIARPGSMVGYVGIPHGVELPIGEMFPRNKGVRGGFAPARAHIPEPLPDVLDGPHQPGPGARLRDRPGRHRRRLRRHGRAPRDQVPRARGDDLMSAWTHDQLRWILQCLGCSDLPPAPAVAGTSVKR